MHNISYTNWFLPLFLLLLLTACKEEEEGCKDIRATNWSSLADKSCESCCSYPDLKLSITHSYTDSMTFQLGEPYTDDFDNVFIVNSLKYYFSDFTLSGEGDSFQVVDSLEVTTIVNDISSTATIRDDVVLISLGVSSTTVGTIGPNGEFIDSLTLKLGVVQPLNSVDPGSVAGTHPLSETTNDMYFSADSGYVFQRLRIIPDTAVTDTLTLEIGGDELLEGLTLPIEVNAAAGFDFNIPINVDYKCWFTGINFAEDSEEIIKEKIVTNLTKSFSLEE